MELILACSANCCLLYTSDSSHFKKYFVGGIVVEVAEPCIPVPICHQKARDRPRKSAKMAPDFFFPVSYTHLDVYKRQLFEGSLRRNQESGSKTMGGAFYLLTFMQV